MALLEDFWGLIQEGKFEDARELLVGKKSMAFTEHKSDAPTQVERKNETHLTAESKDELSSLKTFKDKENNTFLHGVILTYLSIIKNLYSPFSHLRTVNSDTPLPTEKADNTTDACLKLLKSMLALGFSPKLKNKNHQFPLVFGNFDALDFH